MATPICNVHRETLEITEDMRSMIATAFVHAFTPEGSDASLCCADDAIEACMQIIGADRPYAAAFASKLRTWVYEEMGCEAFDDPSYNDDVEQRYLDKITELTEFTIEEVE